MQKSLQILFLILITFSVSYASERDDEIREMMWDKTDEDFNRTDIPGKWQGESAVIIAQMRSYEYKKQPIINQLVYKSYFHNRIKLNDKEAIEKYAEISYIAASSNRDVFVGFKVIKANGDEQHVEEQSAVTMERDGRNNYHKIAIPNLEEGDILDYYIYQEQRISPGSTIFYFDPVIYHLPQQYPVIKQKIQFHINRRCFVSLRSLNGAPELETLVDEENDEQIYYLEDSDREAVSEARWFFPNRELPAIKFRAAYMSGKTERNTDMLVGEAGEVKESVSKQELADYVAFIYSNLQTDPRAMVKHVKKNLGKDARNIDMAKEAYYQYRNEALSYEAIRTVSRDERLVENINYYIDNNLRFLDKFGGFLALMDIPYDILVLAPRNVSSLDDILLENELNFVFRIKEGDDVLYVSYYDKFKIPGELEAELQGIQAYALDGLAKFKDWNPVITSIPISSSANNSQLRKLKLEIDPSFDKAQITVQTEVKGYFKRFKQSALMDYYDYSDEERSRFDMKDDFAGTLWLKKKLESLRDSYMSDRDDKRLEILKELSQKDYDFNIISVDDFEIQSTGRYDTSPAFIYSFSMESDELIGKVGPNYLLNVGKLIENQVKIEKEEIEREVGIHMSAPRSYACEISIQIPEGYEPSGLDKLNVSVENSFGGFSSSAIQEGQEIVIKTVKHYESTSAKPEDWAQIVEFLNAAHSFTEQKILFKKK